MQAESLTYFSISNYQALHQERQIIFIDSQVDDYQILASGIKPDVEVVILNSNRDGIEQITEYLNSQGSRRGEQYSSFPISESAYSAIHIICHGSPGNLYLGSSVVNDRLLETKATLVQQWRKAIAPTAQILIYGCHAAAGDAGEKLLWRLHQLTGATIAANAHLTGNAALGGTWHLGQIHPIPPTPLYPSILPTLPLSPPILAAYPHTLGFDPHITYAAGTAPNAIAVGDFNTDSILDIAVANRNSNNISIFLGIGAGNFSPQTNFNVGTNPTAIAVGDFDNNTNLDIAVTHGASNNLYILLGDGGGSFGVPSITGSGFSLNALAVGQFNADTNLDAVTGRADPNIAVLMGNGAGGFGPENPYNSVSTLSIAVGDFDGDTDLDIATANFVSDTVSIFLNNGSGNFAPSSAPAVGTGPVSVTTGDFDGDGNLDLAVANNTSSNVSVLLGNGAGGFGPQTAVPVGNGLVSIVAGDFSGDGIADLAVTNSSNDNVSVLLGDGAGGFGSETTYAVGDSPTKNALGDFNGDGNLDLAVSNYSSNNISILLNTPIVSITPGITPTEAGPVNGTFNITLDTTAPTGGLTVNFNLTGSTATPTTDYGFAPGTNITSVTANTFTIAAGATTATLNLVPVDDSIDDEAETVILHLATGTGYIVDTINNIATLTITDNDIAGITVTPTTGLVTTEAGGTATFTVVLDSQPTADVTINLTSDNPAEGTVNLPTFTFTNANWNTPQTFTITGVDDFVEDGDIAYNIVTAAATSADANYNGFDAADVAVINTDDDITGITVTPTSGLVTTEAGGTATFTVVLNTIPTADVTINLTSDNPAEGTTLSPLTFTSANWNTPQTVTVTGVDDDIDDGDIAYNIITAATSADANYNGFNVPDVAVTNTDDDTAGITVTPTSVIITEGGATASYDLVLNSQPAAPVTINFTPNSQISPSQAINFDSSNWNVPQTVTVTAVDDGIAEGLHTGSITHSAVSTDANYGGIVIDAVQASITDNDVAGVSVIQPVSRTDVTEGDSSDIFKLVLTSQPTADVTVGITTDSQTTTNVPQVIFTPTNWNLPQTVTVTAVDDTVVDGLQSSTISFTAVSADGFYNGFSISPLTVNVSDNDRDSQVINLPAAAFQSFGDGDDVINAASSGDIVYGGAGNDIINGFGGADFLYGQLGDDIIDGGEDEDLIWAGVGNDHVKGAEGNDVIFAGDGSDRLSGGAGNDELFGDAGNDHLYGDAGADSLTGGLGRDAFAIGNGTGGSSATTADIITDFTQGEDVIDLIYPLSFADISIVQNGADTVIQHQGTGEYFAVLLGITAADIGESDFS